MRTISETNVKQLMNNTRAYIAHLRLWRDDLFDKKMQCVLCGDDNGTRYWAREMDRVLEMIKMEVAK